MSSAFVRERDDQWLSDVAPSMAALVIFLTRENNGIRVYELSMRIDKQGTTIHHMSNGLYYTRNADRAWSVTDPGTSDL